MEKLVNDPRARKVVDVVVVEVKKVKKVKKEKKELEKKAAGSYFSLGK